MGLAVRIELKGYGCKNEGEEVCARIEVKEHAYKNRIKTVGVQESRDMCASI